MAYPPGARHVYQLAQVNVARPVAPLTDPALAGFVEALEPVNALADAAPGFVWRLQDDTGNATSIKLFEDELEIVNFSVWESIEALADFVYRTAHREFLNRRREWFERHVEVDVVLWWVPAGHVPTVDEAKDRLELLRAKGPTPDAFTFRTPSPAPEAPSDR